jgi:hypothetical protein
MKLMASLAPAQAEVDRQRQIKQKPIFQQIFQPISMYIGQFLVDTDIADIQIDDTNILFTDSNLSVSILVNQWPNLLAYQNIAPVCLCMKSKSESC